MAVVAMKNIATLASCKTKMDQNDQPKNEYFAKKEQKEREVKDRKKKATTQKAVKFLILAIALVGVGFWIYKSSTRPPKEEDLRSKGQFFEAQSREHIPVGSEHPTYNSNSPTGGWHYNSPAKTGIYDVEFPDEQIIHNLEHGHIWFAYKPDLPPEQIEQLVKIAKDYGSRIIMTPRSTNDSPIAVAAWQYLLKMGTVDESAIRAFVGTHRNIAGPERNIPDNDFADWRGKTVPTPESTVH